MTTETTSSAALSAGQVITRAYQLLGLLSLDQSPTNDQYNRGLTALNFMLKGWQLDGINLWRQTQIAITVPALGGYPGAPITVTPQIMALESARVVVSTTPLYERPMKVFAYDDYMNLPNKQSSSSSGPSVIMFDKQQLASNFYVWPLWTTGGTINASVGRSILDVLLSTDSIDVPNEWTEGVCYNLADRLADDDDIAASSPASLDRIEKRAIAFYTKALNFDRPTSVIMRPWGRRGRRGIWR